MSRVIADITMSLDGYVSPSSGSVDELQNWVMHQDPVDTEILDRATAATGAVIMGRRLFDIVDQPGVWNSEMAYGAQPPGPQPFFVVSHSVPDDIRLTRGHVHEVATCCTTRPLGPGARRVQFLGLGLASAWASDRVARPSGDSEGGQWSMRRMPMWIAAAPRQT